jgi:hypothetical protein
MAFGTSRDTSDFVADCLERWWSNPQSVYPGVFRLLIDLDNRPGARQFANAVHEAPGGVLDTAPTDVRTSVLLAVSK